MEIIITITSIAYIICFFIEGNMAKKPNITSSSNLQFEQKRSDNILERIEYATKMFAKYIHLWFCFFQRNRESLCYAT
jgi:hypothetical protein